MDHWEAILLSVVFCGLIFGLFAAHSFWQFVLAFFPLSAASAYAIYSYKIGSIKTYYKSKCAEYISAIQHDPRNLGAREYLADAFYSMGELDRAIDELRAAVDLGAGIECRYKLDKWSRERHLRDTTNPVCRWCRTENDSGMRFCKSCGADLPYENPMSRWLMGGTSGIKRYYLILIFGLAATVVSVLWLPLYLALIPLMLLMAILVGGWLVSSARS